MAETGAVFALGAFFGVAATLTIDAIAKARKARKEKNVWHISAGKRV